MSEESPSLFLLYINSAIQIQIIFKNRIRLQTIGKKCSSDLQLLRQNSLDPGPWDVKANTTSLVHQESLQERPMVQWRLIFYSV